MKKSIRIIKKAVPWIVLTSMVIVFCGGMRYYSYDIASAGITSKILASIQNCALTLLFNPAITIEDYTSVFEATEWQSVLFWLALALIPMIDLMIVFSVFNTFLKKAINLTSFFKKRILVIGNNPEIDRMLKSDLRGFRVYRWVDNILSDEVKTDYLQRGIIVKETGLSFGENDNDDRIKLEEFNKFLKWHFVSKVLLLDKADVHNIQLYMILSSCDYCKKKTVQFYTLVNDFEMKCFLQDYFDNRLLSEFANEKKKIPDDAITHMDLNIFNLQQLNAEKTFDLLSLKDENSDSNDVHLLIIGGGYAGREMLIHAMNQGVITAENRIFIDVIDSDIDPVEKILDHRFNTEYVSHDKINHTFEIKPDKSDGFLKIRLTKCDVTEDSFVDEVIKLQDEADEGRFTYLSLCVKEPSINFHIMTSLNQSEKFRALEYKFPIAVRMSNTKQMRDYFEQFSFCSDVLLVGEDDEYIGIDEILNDDREKKMRIYHETYNRMVNGFIWGGGNSCNPDDLWNTNEYFRRASNRALYNHRRIKESFSAQKEIEKFKKAAEGKSGDGELSKLLVEEENGVFRFPKLLEYAKTEHRRFNYFFASEGWGFVDLPVKIPEKRLHNCLCTWDELTKNSRSNMLIYDLISIPEIMNGK